MRFRYSPHSSRVRRSSFLSAFQNYVCFVSVFWINATTTSALGTFYPPGWWTLIEATVDNLGRPIFFKISMLALTML